MNTPIEQLALTQEQHRTWLRRWLRGWVVSLIILGLTSCAVPQVKAEDRLFLPVAIDLLDVYTWPQQDFQGTPVGGLSGLTYDHHRDRLYALSDDRGQLAPSRFYELSLRFKLDSNQHPQFAAINLEQVTPLTDSEGNPYPPGYLDPEGLALSPRNTVLVTSEGDERQDAPPLIGEFDRSTGQLISRFRIPDRFLPDDAPSPTQGIRNNLGFEALTVNATAGTTGQTEPFRLFTATESALGQDYDEDPARPLYCRFLHYLVGTDQATLLAEHAYPLDLEPTGAVSHGLTDLLVIDQGGHFLALERSYGLRGFAVKLYQLATGGATDTSTIPQLKGNLSRIAPIRKRLVFDFAKAPFTVDNLEGMTLGPRLPDGSQSLILVSDNNFEPERPTQLVLLRLRLG